MNAALIGAGQIAKQHLACLRELPNVSVVGLCDLSPALAESAAERFDVPAWFTNHQAMLDQARPDVVHVTTPPPTHFRLALDALETGAHVVIEKPATTTLGDLETLLRRASEENRLLIEDYNYLFNQPVQHIIEQIDSGMFGDVVHVEVLLALDILGPDSPFVDLNLPHPTLSMPGGAIGDFLPHLASLAHRFVGPHRSVRTLWSKRAESPLPHDEFRALVDAERGTASLTFSASAQPDLFWLRAHGTKMRATASLFEGRLTTERLRGGPRPLMPLLNGLEEARTVRRSAVRSLVRKLSGGPGSYEGLWELLARSYRALENRTEPPVSSRQIEEVNRLVFDLTREEATP